MTPRAAGLAFVVLAAAGCGPPPVCNPDTLFVEVPLSGRAAEATQILIDVTVNKLQQRSGFGRDPGVGTETIEIEFPAGYPSGAEILVAVKAESAAGVLATGSGALTGGRECDVVSVPLGDGG